MCAILQCRCVILLIFHICIRLCILLCTTVVLIVDVSFKVCRVLCKDVTDRAVWVCVISKRLLCCNLPGHSQVSALYRSLFYQSHV